MDLEQEILQIKKRNARVEAEKAWETSSVRKILIAVITYLFMVLLMRSLNIANPLINALVPTFGYILSTLTISFAKRVWLTRRKND